MKKALYKVPNGKLIKIFLEDKEGIVVSIKITGDFFLYPEENIEKFEAVLIGAPLKEAEVKQRIVDFLYANPTVFFGFDVDSLVTTILAAASSEAAQ